MFISLDHIAIIVPNTEEALKIWRDRFGFRPLFSEQINNNTILLTHLDLHNTQLQLVEPLKTDHLLWKWLDRNGSGLHHLCLSVDDVADVTTNMLRVGLAAGEPQPHQGTQGKKALFLDMASTGGVQVEITGY